jgi:hypothetical protein
VWTASGSWTLSPLSLEKGEHSVVLHVPEDILTDSEQLLFSLTAADSPEENRLVVRLSGEDVRARLQLSPAPTPTPSPANDQITFTDPARTVLYTNRSLTFETILPMGIQPYGVKLIHAQAQPLEGDMARITVFFSVERDMDLQIRTGSGSWSLPSVTVTPWVKQVAFDIPRSALESDPMLQITLCSPLDPLGPPADGTDALRADQISESAHGFPPENRIWVLNLLYCIFLIDARLKCRWEAAFARRKRRKDAGGKRKRASPRTPHLLRCGRETRLHSGRLWLQRIP